VTLLPFIVLIGAMFLMTRSAKRKQQQAASMRNQMQPGSGVRTIGGMYATVKEVSEETVLLEVAPGTHAVYAKNAIGAVLDDDEYNRIVHGSAEAALDLDTAIVPDDASALTESGTEESDEASVDLGKKTVDLGKDDPAGEESAEAEAEDTKTDAAEAGAADDEAAGAKDTADVVAADAEEAGPKQTKGESDAK
jgi:preprotein translocase subunit YajC